MPKAIAKINALVVGDVMLDEYWFGAVTRISPEAPVPIVHVQHSDMRPGAAANVARNIVSLGAQSTLLAVVGQDETAERLRSALDEAQVRHCLHVDEKNRTTLKLRIVGQHQQMLRIDFEQPPSTEALLAKRADFERLFKVADIIVFSDYGKGALNNVTELISMAKAFGKPMLVDPKGRDFDRYRGVSVIKPNKTELADAVGQWSSEEEMDRKAEALRAALDLDALVVTMSEEGMKAFLPGRIIREQAHALEVFDVSGAGDTVIAALAVMLGSGQSWDNTIAFANAAGGVAVGKLGTSIVLMDEVQQFLRGSA
jgi:rfaE bifunctional protein kinase chain/domain